MLSLDVASTSLLMQDAFFKTHELSKCTTLKDIIEKSDDVEAFNYNIISDTRCNLSKIFFDKGYLYSDMLASLYINYEIYLAYIKNIFKLKREDFSDEKTVLLMLNFCQICIVEFKNYLKSNRKIKGLIDIDGAKYPFELDDLVDIMDSFIC